MATEECSDRALPLIGPYSVYKIVLIGASNVGKTCLLSKFIGGDYAHLESSTIIAGFKRKSIAVNEETVTLDIWDTTGQDRFHCLIAVYLKDAQAAVVVFDLTCRRSFREARERIDIVTRDYPGIRVIALCGTKSDLSCQQEVKAADVRQYADDNSLLYVETSAKTGLNVIDLFTAVASRVQHELSIGSA